jgi:hypothetical protein
MMTVMAVMVVMEVMEVMEVRFEFQVKDNFDC